MLSRLQRGLERLYRIDTRLAVEDFVVDEDTRAAAGVARSPREQLLLSEDEDGMSLGLFVDPEVLEGLAAAGDARDAIRHRLGDFLLAVEGVSHFVYLSWRAQAEQSVSALELELQAEVDKYVTCLLSADDLGRASPRLRRRLYEEVEYLEDLDAAERDRYRIANDSAHRYSGSLETRYLRSRRLADMLGELRRFYRLPLAGKLEHIRRAAA